MSKKWAIFSICALTAAVIVTAVAELISGSDDEEATEEI